MVIDSKVFGIGLGKTGTTTLGICLEQLGYDHQGCNEELTRCLRAGNWTPIWQVADRHNALEDFPWPLAYKEMDARYPGSKFILTTRINSEVWFKSLVKHADRTGPTEHKKLAYGYEMPHPFKREHIAFYEQHNQEARQYFEGRETDFLEVCWERGDGWQKICDFLGHEVPNTEFPWSNKAPGFWSRWKYRIKQAGKAILNRETLT